MATAPLRLSDWLPSVDAALVVIAHPDDESFGLGAVLHALVTAGAGVDVLCFTHGEASTLGEAPDLGKLRKAELLAAAAELGLRRVTLLDRPDGLLDQQPDYELDADVEGALLDAGLLVVFEPEGVTGHPDHRAATAAGLRAAARHSLPVLEWGVHPEVARALRCEFGAPFVSLDGPETVDVLVDRTTQHAAIACHQSQANDNPVLRRRLQLQGRRERLRYRRPA
jgi:LmbE family N-acetylglucosaminyl deacetylase